MSRREKILEIVASKFETLKESGVSFEVYNDLAEKMTEEIMALSKPKEEIIHVIGPQGQHRLQVDGVTTDWRPPNEINRLNDYIACTDFYHKQLPQIGKVIEIDSKQFRTHSTQSTKLEIVRFSTADQL